MSWSMLTWTKSISHIYYRSDTDCKGHPSGFVSIHRLDQWYAAVNQVLLPILVRWESGGCKPDHLWIGCTDRLRKWGTDVLPFRVDYQEDGTQPSAHPRSHHHCRKRCLINNPYDLVAFRETTTDTFLWAGLLKYSHILLFHWKKIVFFPWVVLIKLSNCHF